MQTSNSTKFDPKPARPSFADVWVGLGLACYRLGEVRPAEHALQRALLAVPGHGAAEATSAAFDLLRGETDAALLRLRAALARDADCLPARLNLTNVLLLERMRTKSSICWRVLPRTAVMAPIGGPTGRSR